MMAGPGAVGKLDGSNAPYDADGDAPPLKVAAPVDSGPVEVPE